MVQTDIFWSYAIGATFAAAASKQLKRDYDDSKDNRWSRSKYFVYTVLFLACLFAPTGSYLLWDFPQWETMQIATSHAAIPAWFVSLFAISNVLLGVLGYRVGYGLIKRGRVHLAWLQVAAGYLIMTVVLTYGWDGTGWQRFLYDSTTHNGKLWAPGMYDGIAFFSGNVAHALYGMGIIVLPFLLVPVVKWIRE
ncbi:MAG: hypothetical protein M1491_01315 [Deltaproteobacteria bacterium]|nr:hypothetical protein [Deltaproteobacteria bacterium]MCL5276858.1 hypothetical protein [Deltaproteobacteria bacterium]